MKKLFSTTQNPLHRAMAVVLLMSLQFLWGIPAIAQQVSTGDGCTYYLPSVATQVAPGQIIANDRTGGINGQHVRIVAYYDSTIPAALGISVASWESLLQSNINMFDSTLFNLCVSEDYGNLAIKILPASIPLPADVDVLYTMAAVTQGSPVHQMWKTDEDCYQAHIVIFIPPVGAIGPRGTSTVITSAFASEQTGIAVIRSDQIGNQSNNRTLPHELGHSFGGFHPGDAFAPNPSFCGVGNTPDGHRSLMKSPTTDMTILTEGRIETDQCSTSLFNGTSDLGFNWTETYMAYTGSRPDFAMETNVTQSTIIADSQSVAFTTTVNRVNVDYQWMKNGYPFSNQAAFDYQPTASDTGVVVFDLTATNCGGEQIAQQITIQVNPKPAATTSTTDIAWSGFRMFPNPVADNLRFDQPYNVQIFDMTGNLVSHIQSTNSINMSDVPRGVYAVHIANNGRSVVRRIAKM